MACRLRVVVAVAILGVVAGCHGPLTSGGTAAASSADAVPAPSTSSLAKLERSLVFQPSQYPAGNWQPTGFAFEDAWFTASDGTRLHGWYLAHEHPRAVVLYCHGNAGNVALWAPALHVLHDRVGVSVLGFDYRGYGRSQGIPSEAGLMADARAARTWLAERSGVPEGQIVLIGRSLGGAVAVELAASEGARALILESTFTKLPDAAHSILPWLPVRSLIHSEFNSLAKIVSYHGPLLQSHGTADRVVPYELGRQLFAAANDPKEFFEISGTAHNDPQPAAYYDALRAFLSRL